MPLWPFQNVVCHSIPYQAAFIAPRCSPAYCLYVLCLATLILLPLFVTFSSDNVWMKESYYVEQPLVDFRHELLLVVGGDSRGNAVGWSTNADLSPLLPAQVQVPLVRSASIDNNHDGVPDAWTLSLQMPKVISSLQSVTLMAVYDFELRDKIHEKIGALVTVDISSPYPASGVWVQGDLRLKQGLPLRMEQGQRNVYADNPLSLNFTANWIFANQPLSTRALLQRYSARNESVVLTQDIPPTWDYSLRDTINIELALNVPAQTIRYVPSAWEMVKYAWVQVLSFVIPTWLALNAVKTFAYDNQLVETHVVPQLPSPDDS